MEINFETSKSDFFKRLRDEVNDYFRRNNINSTGGSRLWIKTVVICLVLAGIYGSLVYFSPDSWWLCIGLYIILGVFVALSGFNMMHDGAHGSFSRHKIVNRMMAYSLNVLGGNSLFWSKKHNINHHTYTNIDVADDDINFDPFLRLHDNQRKKWFHRYQHIYAPVLYGFSYMMWIYFLDFKKYFTGKLNDNSNIPPMNLKEHLIFWLSKIFHIAVFVVVPILALGFAKAFVGYLISATVTGFTISIIFQLAHIVEGLGFSTPTDGIVDIKSEWAIHQVNTTANFATNSKVLTWFLGGLNYQMVHHLFPKISHVHYPAIHPIIMAACKEYNLKYTEFPHLGNAIASHFRHLKKTGVAAYPALS